MTDLLTDYAVNWLRQPRERPFCLYLAHKAVHGPFTPAERHKDRFAGVEIALSFYSWSYSLFYPSRTFHTL
jgi:N-acetylglucosamine-6-sulfatase